MKLDKVKVFVLSALSGMLLVGCTAEEEFEKENFDGLSVLKSKIYATANKYGLSNINIDDAELVNNQNMTDEEIENVMKGFASLKGRYTAVRKGNVFKLSKRRNVMRKRSGIENNSETLSGTAIFRNFSLYITLEYDGSNVKMYDISASLSSTTGWEQCNVSVKDEKVSFYKADDFVYTANVRISTNRGVSHDLILVCEYSNGYLDCNLM